MKQLKSKKYTALFFTILLASFWVFGAVLNFMYTLQQIETNATTSDLESLADCNAAQTRMIFDQYIQTLSLVAKSIERVDADSTEALSFLQSMAKNNVFTRLSIDLTSGSSYTSDGYTLNVTPLQYLDKISQGKPFILDVTDSLVDAIPMIHIIVPIQSGNGAYEAALRGSISTATLTEAFEKTFATSGGYYHIVDGNGRYVSPGAAQNALLMDQNYWDAVDMMSFEDGFSADQLRDAFARRQKGIMQYSYDGHARYGSYAPIEINDWEILMIIPSEIVEATSNRHTFNAVLLMLQIVVVLLFFVFYAYFTQKRARDIAQLNEKCFKALTEQTNKAIFEWDYESRTIHYLSDFKRIFGKEGETYWTAAQAIDSQNVHPDDRQALDMVYSAIALAENISNVQFRILDNKGDFHWCDISLTFVNKQNGKPYKAVGFIENIDERMQKEQQLRRKSEIDQLTNIYNKSTTEYLIETVLKESTPESCRHALMIVDIDNYKSVNDSLGHLYGDIVLSQLAAALKTIFRTGDILGRLGGDEFFILLKDFDSETLLHEKAAEICEKLRKTYSEGDTSVRISASVGVSVYPWHGINFEQLYAAADVALYNVKANGKNNYMLYNGVKAQHYTSNRTDIDNSSGAQKNFHGNKLEYLFKLLYDSDNPKLAVMSVLQLIAEQYGLSRANVFELDQTDLTFSCVFEWRANGIASIKATQQNIPLEACQFLIDEAAKSSGMFTKNVIDMQDSVQEAYQAMGIRSMIFFAIADAEHVIGNIVFQDCIHDKMRLTPGELNEIKTICQVLATFLLKQFSAEHEKQYRRLLETVLNNMDGFAYVIDPENWRIIFENQRICEITQSASVGRVCYEAFQHRASPCENCPIQRLSESCHKATVEINNAIYHIISKTTASEMEWSNGKKAYLVNSIDVTEYKQGGQNS